MITRIKMGIGQRSSCRNGFKELDILTVPSLYIFSIDDICQTVQSTFRPTPQYSVYTPGIKTNYTHPQ
jgi:hypothetical protein